MPDKLPVSGSVVIKKNGKIICEGRNLVVTTGKNLIASIVAAGTGLITKMQIGDSGVAGDESMTALQGTEIEEVALDSTSSHENTVTYIATFGAGVVSAEVVREIAILNAADVMLARFLPVPFTAETGDAVEVSWTLQFGI